MRREESYPNLCLFFDGYLNQDYRYLDATVNGVIEIYKKSITPSMRRSVILEIDDFKNNYSSNLDDAFEDAFGQEISIEKMGFTASSFLDELKKLLQD
ncbi:contact-dependent growth inhibition system immunity protein [Trinickia mobilis]|uniref:contact-dependent growth inhibition system immunity protein n=1 Tax=Trinickia mobilis TaxID=2816356 RepID=UPI001A8C4752|nr:contact-dependent growth inhibition system immunity protein [Trinickia mobilis]